MDTKLKNMLEEFGVKSTNALLLNKQKETQTRVFSSGKPGLVKLSADECKKLCDKAGIVYSPGYEQRVVSYIVSDERKDRYGDIVRAKGAKFENFRKNPVMFFGHDYGRPPIGNSIKEWVSRKDNNVQSWGLFVDENIDKSGFSDLIFRLASSGFMKACSIGFRPIAANVPKNQAEAENMGLGAYGVEFTSWDMLEWSPCGVPANPGALQNALNSVDHLDIRKEDFDIAEQFNLFDYNVLDMFKGLTIGDGKPRYVGIEIPAQFKDKDIGATSEQLTFPKIGIPEDISIPGTIQYSIDGKEVTKEEYNEYQKANNTEDTVFVDGSGTHYSIKTKEEYSCECIDCGHTLKSDKHCKDIKCPECGGTMRREERPGPGQNSDEGKSVTINIKDPISAEKIIKMLRYGEFKHFLDNFKSKPDFPSGSAKVNESGQEIVLPKGKVIKCDPGPTLELSADPIRPTINIDLNPVTDAIVEMKELLNEMKTIHKDIKELVKRNVSKKSDSEYDLYNQQNQSLFPKPKF